jgi:hypothetical protein
MRRFHHIGLLAADQSQAIAGEAWVASSRCWVSNPADHPQRVEWLRYAADVPAVEMTRTVPHICYTVDDLAAAIDGKPLVMGPFEPGEPPFGRAAFVDEDGIVVEYLQLFPGRAWFTDDLT